MAESAAKPESVDFEWCEETGFAAPSTNHCWRPLEALSAARWVRRAAARQLKIHINSMTYRVERIQSLTGLQLDDPETRVAISIALRARTMLGM
ncbi:MAG TPA: helix-turn-helix domain-containing protein [Candidatus Dormibacteraeota bacterium]|nr:helix-turn-helix domain-containing protein [Candidatus Dormibacteraeota bacterium]